MVRTFNKPNLKAPRYREKRLGLLNKHTIREFKDKYPLYENIDNDKLKSIIKLYNKNLWNAVIKYREGVELPYSEDFLKSIFLQVSNYNIDFRKSSEYGKILQNKNWETDGNIAKIFYSNCSTKYKFKNRELWKFEAVRDFKRSVATQYPEDWTKYIVIQNKYQMTHLYKGNIDEKSLEDYNEFEI